MKTQRTAVVIAIAAGTLLLGLAQPAWSGHKERGGAGHRGATHHHSYAPHHRSYRHARKHWRRSHHYRSHGHYRHHGRWHYGGHYYGGHHYGGHRYPYPGGYGYHGAYHYSGHHDDAFKLAAGAALLGTIVHAAHASAPVAAGYDPGWAATRVLEPVVGYRRDSTGDCFAISTDEAGNELWTLVDPAHCR
ncbi:MAG: hypothetical protein GTN86_12425 [Xanthomonadales bacterium]|nr:hypothetical protein [Xanthomonadales bacterium]NIN60528.1 hypothetical protein [Xanthomonadales bacterium]NIN75883.1 hypothetical protein [Xanthomonadales bacterium]NIO15273.1 hypothetical protein [Xanthomonadales bacterium]NIP12921.1 hypothetical protein [Xanthomonadales bacterium]